MPILSLRSAVTVTALGALAVAASACTSKASDSGDNTLKVTSTDSACDLTGDATTGTVSFAITNNGGKVTEFYVYNNNNRVLGEVENIGPGLEGKLTVEITQPGSYTVACKPGMVGQGIRKQIDVGGAAKSAAPVPADVDAAKKSYLGYVRDQTTLLVSQTTDFVNAVKSGDLDKARAIFGQARTPYERIEPVAESFPDLDPAIDMRWDDTEGGTVPFTGFHRIERFLWPPQPNEVGEADGQISPADVANAKKEDTKANIDKAADDLLANVKKLQTEIAKPDFVFETLSFVNGPKALIDEVAKTKVGGEEDRYSHTDLWDFAANLDGSQRLITDMEPILTKNNQALLTKINAAFDDVNNDLQQFQRGTGYVTYTEVNQQQRQAISDKVDALSTTLSEVPNVVLRK